MIIPQCSPFFNYQAHKDEIDHAVRRVMDSGRYIMGCEVESFEQEFAAWNNSSHCVSCANGTDALELILRALGIAPGDQVITVANTAVATVAAIERAGAEPLFADIDPSTFTMSPEALDRILKQKSRNVKAVIAVHLFGHPAAVENIASITEKYGTILVEDCAQAHGAAVNGRKVGTFGAAAGFSFYPTKNLGALGDGGAVITNSTEMAVKIRELRQYGWRERYISSVSGINSRLDEIQAAILRVKLRYLEEDNDKRRRLAQIYSNELSSLDSVILPKTVSGYNHVFHQYVILAEARKSLQEFLQSENIGTAIHYPLPIHKQPAYLRFSVELPNTEALNEKLFSLPFFPELGDSDVIRIAGLIKKFYS